MLRKSLVTLFSCLTLISTGASWAQTYPNKPIRVIVPFGPGGPDALARMIGAQLGAQTGQAFVVENKPGANGILGAEALAKSAPDGYTIMITSSGFVAAPSVYKKLPYDTEKDFAPVTNLVENPGIFVAVNPGVPARTLQELIDLARKPDSKLSYGTPGVGNTLHLSGEFFNARAGTTILHIPYKGAGPAMVDVVGGHVQLLMDNIPSVQTNVSGGRLKVIGVTSAKRSGAMPNAPTFAESGLPGFEANSWWALLVPAATPRDIVARLNAEMLKVLQSAETREKFLGVGAEPAPGTPEEANSHIRGEVAKWAPIVKASGARVD